jgi:N-acyl-L-homoserine lactone synthetase
MTFTYHQINDQAMLKKAFQFRCSIWCDEQGLLNENDYQNREENDQYDPYAIHFVVLDTNHEIAAYARLIHNSPIGYPTENNMVFDCNSSIFDRKHLGEISRISINKNYRACTTLIFELMRFITIVLRERDIKYTFGAMERGFIRLLRINRIKYEKIGRRQYHIGWRYPCVLYTEQLLQDNPEFVNTQWGDYV